MVDEEQVPQFRRTEEARQCQKAAPDHHLRVCQAIGADDVLNESEKPVHVLAAGNACALSLILAAELLLLRGSRGAVSPEHADGFAGSLFVLGKIKGHQRPFV